MNEFWVLLLGVKNEKPGKRLRKIYAARKNGKFSWNRQGIILQSRGMVRKILRRLFLGAVYNGTEPATWGVL